MPQFREDRSAHRRPSLARFRFRARNFQQRRPVGTGAA